MRLVASSNAGLDFGGSNLAIVCEEDEMLMMNGYKYAGTEGKQKVRRKRSCAEQTLSISVD